MRNILTKEISEYISDSIKKDGDITISAFVRNIEPDAIELFSNVTIDMMAKIISHIDTLNTSDRTSLIESLNLVKSSVNKAFLIGWMTEHLTRNNIELEKCPELKKYISVCSDEIDTIKSLEYLLKNDIKKSDKKSNELNNYEDFMNAISSS